MCLKLRKHTLKLLIQIQTLSHIKKLLMNLISKRKQMNDEKVIQQIN